MKDFQDFEVFDDITGVSSVNRSTDISSPIKYSVNCSTPNTESPSSPDGFTVGLDIVLEFFNNKDIFDIKSTTNLTNTTIESNESSEIQKSIESNYLLTVNRKSHLDPSLLFFLNTIIKIRDYAILTNDHEALIQFDKFEGVLSKFTQLMQVQDEEKVTRKIGVPKGKKLPDLTTTHIDYILEFLTVNHIDISNLFTGFLSSPMYDNHIEPLETKKRKLVESESSSSNPSTSFQQYISSIVNSSLSTPSRYISNSVIIVEPPFMTTSVQCDGGMNQTSAGTGPTKQRTSISPTILDQNKEESNIVRNYKDDFNSTPVKVPLPMYQLDHSNTVLNFLIVKQIPIEIIDATDMFISMLLYLKFGILLFPNSSIFQPSFLDCLAKNMNTTLNNIQLTIIEFINKNVNNEVFLDTTEPFLNAYKDEINRNNISKPTYHFLYNHLTMIFKVHIIFFSYRDSKVMLNYCPTNINLQSHDFNEENTIAIIENKGIFKKLWTMEPRFLLSSVSSADSNTVE